MTKISDLDQDASSSFSGKNEESRVQDFAKHMLKSTLFIGTFQEKRYVEPLNAYRDVIKVGDDESDFIENLIAVKKRCAKFYVKGVWIGITEPKTIGAPSGYSLWVNLNEEVFGSYWYKIKSVEFLPNEVRLKLEIVRPVSRENVDVHNVTPQQILEDISQADVSALSAAVGSYFKEKIREVFTETLTVANIKEAIIFIFLLLSTLITFSIHAIKYLLEYILKLLHEAQGLIKACTPIIISFMKLIMNTINGFYALIAIMWRSQSSPKMDPSVYQMLQYDHQYYRTRALPPLAYQSSEGDIQRRFYKPYKSSVTITPLD